MKKVISSPLAPAAIGPYSQATEAAGLVFVSHIHNDFIIMKEIRPACDPNGVYSVKRTCAELGISNKTLKKYRENGYIQPRHIQWRIATLPAIMATVNHSNTVESKRK